MAETQIDYGQIDTPIKVTGMYPLFYTHANSTGTAGNSYTTSGVALPRTKEADEEIILIPVGARWCTPQLISYSSTTFSFIMNCVIATSVMTVQWSAIYYKAN